MKLPINRRSRKGSGMVEAAMVMPFFLLAVLMLLSPIRVVSVWENVIFSACDEMRYETAKAAFFEEPIAMKVRMKQRIQQENPDIDGFRIKSCRYLYQKQGIQDLLTVNYVFSHSGFDPLGLFRDTSFEMSITGRAFTGKLHQQAPTSATNADDVTVYVFPEWGMRYHKKSCTYVKTGCEMVYLTAETKRKYDPCSLCHAKSAQNGSPVFCFTKYGSVYHMDHCKTVERYYIAIKKTKACSQGYSPCLKCGG